MDNNFKDLTEGLNSAQKEAVTNIEGPSLIVAGAGSGKTRVLTCRVAQIIRSGGRPGEILALTFTKKAAQEMKNRIADLVGDYQARWIWMGTFHSIFIRFLREYAGQLGYPEQFTIYDQSDSRSIVKQCIKELQLDDKTYKPNIIQNIISRAKNDLVTIKGYKESIERMEADRAARRPRTVEVYELYRNKCRANGAMDFDDILLNMNVLLRDFPDACQAISSRFRYILVDEYQDTNYAQYLILKKLAANHQNLCVVGDDSQSIYGFRGARIENILRFKKDYPQAREFKLEQNYRSTQNIVGAANSLIAHNENRLKKECFSRAGEGEKIGVIKAFTETEEAFLITTSIKDKIFEKKLSYDNFAVLYRTNAQSRAIEESLRKHNLPFRIYGGHSFYERAEIKDMLAYFKLIVNTKDNESFRRIVNVPARGIGDTSLERLAAAATAEKCSLYDATFLPAEKLAEAGLRDASVKKFREFSAMMEQLAQKVATEDCYSLALEVGNSSGYLVSLHADTSPEGIARFENIEELFNSIKEYSEEETEMRRELLDDETEEVQTVTLGDYLENIMLLSEAEKDDTQDADADNSNKITLMTVHSSKGLEFPYVYIAGMEENLFPSESMNDTPAEIEEERRLFYVALTRAMKGVTVSFAQNRRKWGSEESNRPSRFLREIDDKYFATHIVDEAESFLGNTSIFRKSATPKNDGPRYEAPRYGRPGEQRIQRMPAPAARPVSVPAHVPSSNPVCAISELKENLRVEHERFGYGTILSIDGDGADRKAVVEFDTCGRKTLLLKFARLRLA